MRRLSLFIFSLLLSTPLWAMHCPADMAKIDEILKTDPPHDQTVLAEVRKLRAEGEALHKAGKHTESVKVLGQALDLLEAGS
ncbi:MAG: hypothetical protein WA173_00050 [Pseudomonas sp.]|uniref:hypothetical protein n=1 Tax=Pseudomonas sp. TaxID=306 RepID=UPI00271E6951|nr:hypothetical protein [Pseudomonas sp.]